MGIQHTSQETAFSIRGVFAAVQKLQKTVQTVDLDLVEAIQKNPRDDAGHSHDQG